MEIILKEIVKYPYTRNMNIFDKGVYYNTYKYNPKPGDIIHELEEGIFRFEKGSSIREKIYDQLVSQFFVVKDNVYCQLKDNDSIYLIKKDETFKTNFNLLSHIYINNQSIIAEAKYEGDGRWSNFSSKMFYQEREEYIFKEYGHFINNASLHFEEKDDCLFIIGTKSNGDRKWSFNLNERLKLEKGYFKGTSNQMNKIFAIKNSYWVLYFHNNTILKLNSSGEIDWFRTNLTYHTYIPKRGNLYGISQREIVKINAETGEIINSSNITKILSKYNCEIYRGNGIWIYEDYIFIPCPKRSIEWLVFHRETLKEVGHMRIDLKDDEVVLIPGMLCSNFIYGKGKVYINDTANWLRVYDVEFNKLNQFYA